MPRTRQGGPRGGSAGNRYQNRTDIANQPSLAARAATGQTYGKAQSQLQAQKMVPMAPPRLALPPPGAGGGAIPPPGAPPGAGIPQGPVPGSLGQLTRPSERPLEPVTSGAALGPGPGPETLMQPGATKVSDILAQAAQRTGSTVLQNMAQRAQVAGQ